MIAHVTIAADRDLAQVAEAAGQPNPDKRHYEAGVLHVEGVPQAALEAAAATATLALTDPVVSRLRADDVLRALVEALAKRLTIPAADLIAAIKAERRS